jgi:hypothetical protein
MIVVIAGGASFRMAEGVTQLIGATAPAHRRGVSRPRCW